MRSRPWLLLWLVPYLCLGVLSGGHNHGFNDSDSDDAAPVAAHAQHSHLDDHLHHSEQGGAHFECLACQWAGHATALCPAPLQLAPAAAVPRFVVSSFSPLAPRTWGAATIRGPPVA